jgi:TorA-specific chaperone
MPPPDLLSDRQQHALVDAVALISRVFWGPSREDCSAMVNGEFLEPFRTLSPLLPAECSDALQEINDFIFTHTDADSLYDTLEAAYVRRFISDRGGITAPLYESCYTGTTRGREAGLLMGTAAVAMRRRLESAGLAMDEKIGQMPDHLSVELEYLYFLIHKEVNDGEDCLKNEIRSFASEVMLPWVLEFRKQLERNKEEEETFYLQMTVLLASLLDLVSGKYAYK